MDFSLGPDPYSGIASIFRWEARCTQCGIIEGSFSPPSPNSKKNHIFKTLYLWPIHANWLFSPLVIHMSALWCGLPASNSASLRFREKAPLDTPKIKNIYFAIFSSAYQIVSLFDMYIVIAERIDGTLDHWKSHPPPPNRNKIYIFFISTSKMASDLIWWISLNFSTFCQFSWEKNLITFFCYETSLRCCVSTGKN